MLGAIQRQTSVHPTRRVAVLYARGETDTARTHPTKHGPLGCRGKSIAAGATNSDCFYKTHAAGASSCQRVVPLAAERSVLCPVCPRCVRFSMSVETGHV